MLGGGRTREEGEGRKVKGGRGGEEVQVQQRREEKEGDLKEGRRVLGHRN